MLFYLYKSLKKKNEIRNIKINSKMKYWTFFWISTCHLNVASN